MTQSPAPRPSPDHYFAWPNRITLLRLILIAPFVWLMLHQQQRPGYRQAAVVIFLVMALSDLLDGLLARRYNLKSRLGAILDPIADKTLITCAAILLTLDVSHVAEARLPDWAVVAIIGKDLWVVVGFMVVFLVTGRVRVHPTWPGKAATAAQAAMVLAILLSHELNMLGQWLAGYNTGLALATATWWAAAAFSVLAAISYTRLGWRYLAEAANAPHEK